MEGFILLNISNVKKIGKYDRYQWI